MTTEGEFHAPMPVHFAETGLKELMTSTDTTDDLTRSPLHEAHLAAGARFTDFAGWQLPVSYGSALAEHHAVREAAALFDLSHMAEIRVTGVDAAPALDFALAGRASAIGEGRAKYSLLLDESGGIIDDVVVYRLARDEFLVVANASNRAAVVADLTERSARFSAHVADETDATALIAVQGPAALDVVRDAAEGDDALARALGNLAYYASAQLTLAGHSAFVSRTGYTGEDGFELYVAPDAALPLWNALLAAGASHGLIAAGLGARDSLRLEAGMPLYGHELSRDVLPQQARLGRVVALDADHDFVGRAAVESGPRDGARVLVGLAGEGRRAAREGYDVRAGGASVGIVTSGILSPTLSHPIAMASVNPQFAELGTRVSVDIRGTEHPFTVTELPFYRKKKK